MQPELLQSSWPSFNHRNSNPFGDYGFVIDNAMDHYEFSSPFITTEDSSDTSIISTLQTLFSDDFMDLPVLVEELDATLPENGFPISLEDFEIEDMSESLGECEKSLPYQELPNDGVDDGWSLSSLMKSSDTSMNILLTEASLILPTEDMELNNELNVIHLLEAYKEAMDKEQKELAEVIAKCINNKVSPVGGVMERVLYYMFQSSDKQATYLKQESKRNFLAAFMAFYQLFPYGKFAHFAANMAILEAMPRDVEVIRIFDFDMGEGIQWSSMIEAIGYQQREIRLTSIKWISEEDSNCDPSQWRFEETKKRLCDHARSFGLKLTVDSMELHDLVSELKKRRGISEWLAFNCMVGLPHMVRVRSRRDVSEFLRVANEVLAYGANYNYKTLGIITFGDGDAWIKSKSSSSFGSFLDGHLVHYQALLESIQWTFPIHLGEARTALECLFVSPLISSIAWIHKCKEIDSCDLQTGFGLKGWQLSKESLMEAKEMVREGENLYEVGIEGENNNYMVLNWREIPLVRFSCWRN